MNCFRCEHTCPCAATAERKRRACEFSNPFLGGIHCPEPPADLAERLTANMLRQRYEEPRKTFRVSAVMFAGITACSMFATLLALNYASAHHGMAPTSVATRGGSKLPPMDGPESVGTTSGITAGGPTISAANFGFR